MPSVTVLLRTRNAGLDFGPLLDVLGRQRVAPAELLVVDSGSTDGTPERARAVGARVVPLDPGRFTHARSTNLGFREAKGEIVAMLSQDALPVGEEWLAALVAPLEEPRVVAAFGRQVPRPGCFPLEAWELGRCYPEGGPAGVVYSNVNSAARRASWEEIPFDESVDIAEDRLWALAQMARRRRIVYVPEASVIHSHAYTLRSVYRRCRDEARVRREREGIQEAWSVLFRGWPKQTLRDARRLSGEGRGRLWPQAAAYRLAQLAGVVAGGRP
jgi:glycosyltransferase involved in cell wall biosynthesis